MTAPGQFARNAAWRVVLAAGVGCALGPTALPFYTIGVFVRPLVATFGWSRASVQAAVTCALLGVLCSAWATGWLIDRIGVRRVALGSRFGLALGFVALAFQNYNVWAWYANRLVMAVVGVGTTPLTRSRGIGGWFDRQRGLALGIALSGTGVTAFAAPLLLTPLIAALGWRVAYGVIAAAILMVGMPTVAALFRERSVPAPAGAAPVTGLLLLLGPGPLSRAPLTGSRITAQRTPSRPRRPS